MNLVMGTHKTPLGLVAFALDGAAVCALDFEERVCALRASVARRFGREPTSDDVATRPLVERLDRYFEGELRALDDVVVSAEGTPFQQCVWAALRAIPAGQRRAYSDVALAIGADRAARAVGAANRKNPVALVVPCHRVVGRDGTLTGYAGGVERKRWLLEHEQRSSSQAYGHSGVNPELLK